MLSVLPPARLWSTYVLASGAIRVTTRSPIYVCTMWTVAVAVADALPAQPETVIGDSTVERSGICTSAPLVAAQPVGLGVGDGDGVGLGVGVGVGVGVAMGSTVNDRVCAGEPFPARSVAYIEKVYAPAASPL